MKADDLRASILQAAIQGKLTKQDPNDEPASVLVERIRDEKHRLVREGKIKRDKNESFIFKRDGSWFETINGKDERCIDDEIPFEIPDNWTWARQKEVFTLINGRAYSQSELLSSGKYRVIRVGNFFTNSEWYYSDLELEDEKYCNTGDLLYAWSMSFGPKIWDKEHSIFHYHIWKVDYSDAFYRDFLYYWLLEDTISIRQEKHGTSMQHVTMKMMNDRLCVIPPYSEQKRIVSAIMSYDDLIHSYDELELKYSTLISTIQSKLQISILQEAIQGNLVKQDPNDEPASVLVERIRDEKHRLVREGKIKRDKNESFIFKRDGSWFETINGKDERCIDDEIPFEIPENWVWTRLGFLTNYGKNVQISSSEIVPGSYVVELEDIEKNTGRIIKLSSVSECKDSNRNVFRSGNILYSKLRPYLNKVAIPDFDGFCSSEIMVLDVPPEFSSLYLQIVLMSPYFVNYATSKSYGTKMPRLGTEDGRNALIPIPSMDEQKRIVDYIKQILNQVNMLKQIQG